MKKPVIASASALTLVASLTVGLSSANPATAADQVLVISGSDVQGKPVQWTASNSGVVKLEVVGGGGTGSAADGSLTAGAGGKGAFVTSYHLVTKNEKWEIRAGGAGAAAGSGGAASAVVDLGTGSPISVAGGGGGAAASTLEGGIHGNGGDGAFENGPAGGDGVKALDAAEGKGGNVHGGDGGGPYGGAGGVGTTNGGDGTSTSGGGGGGTNSDGGSGDVIGGERPSGNGGLSAYFGKTADGSVGGGGAGFGGGGGAALRVQEREMAFGGSGGGGYGGGGGAHGVSLVGKGFGGGGGAGGSFADESSKPSDKPDPTYRPGPIVIGSELFGLGRNPGEVLSEQNFGVVRLTFTPDPTPPTPPAPVVKRQSQHLRPGATPKKVKTRGTTVLNKRRAKTREGRPLRAKGKITSVRGEVRCARWIRGKQRKLSIRTYGKCSFRLSVTYIAKGNSKYKAFRTVKKYRVKR